MSQDSERPPGKERARPRSLPLPTPRSRSAAPPATPASTESGAGKPTERLEVPRLPSEGPPTERPGNPPPARPSRHSTRCADAGEDEVPAPPPAPRAETPRPVPSPAPRAEAPRTESPRAASASRPQASAEPRRALLQTREAGGHEMVVADDRFVPGDLKLVVEQGLSINKEFLVSDPEMLLGRRDPDQDFIPDIDLFDQETATNRYISRRQARIFFQSGGLWVEDLDSSNGTAVNNRLIPAHEPRPVKPGDKVLLGQSVMLRVRRVAT